MSVSMKNSEKNEILPRNGTPTTWGATIQPMWPSCEFPRVLPGAFGTRLTAVS